MKFKTEAERELAFMAKVYVEPLTGCWLWAGGVNDHGYGTFTAAGPHTVRAHRWSFERFIGPIDPGLEIDHLCRTTLCVNPKHLEAVSRSVNMQRRSAPCPHGNRNKRTCVDCNRDKHRRWRQTHVRRRVDGRRISMPREVMPN